MASRKGGVYDLLDFKYSEDPRAESEGSREEEMYQEAAAIVEDEWDEGVTMRRDALSQSAEFQRQVEKEIAVLRKTFPLEEHWYGFEYEPKGRPATSWQIHTAKLPDGSWEGTISRFTGDKRDVYGFSDRRPRKPPPQVIGHDPEGRPIVQIDEEDIVQLISLAEGVGGPTFHERFEEKLAPNERALLGALVRLAEGWSRRSNPRKTKRKRKRSRGSAERRRRLNRLLRGT